MAHGFVGIAGRLQPSFEYGRNPPVGRMVTCRCNLDHRQVLQARLVLQRRAPVPIQPFHQLRLLIAGQALEDGFAEFAISLLNYDVYHAYGPMAS